MTFVLINLYCEYTTIAQGSFPQRGNDPRIHALWSDVPTIHNVGDSEISDTKYS